MIRNLLLACLGTVAVFAATPDFSGTWEMDSTRSDSAASGSSTGPTTVLIKQTPNEVTIETKQGDQVESLIYKLDGSTTEKPAPDNGPFAWRAELSGSQLITETHRNVNRATVTVREVRSLEKGGKEMLLNRSLTVQHGYQMRGAKNYATGKDIFVKKPKT